MISEPFAFYKTPEGSVFDDYTKGRAGKRAE
jgi:hypothetical protein